MSSDKVYVIGATGNIGIKVVTNLLAQGISTTIFVRNVEKSRALFKDNIHLTLVEGDYTNLLAFKSSIAGHSRLFLLIADLPKMPSIKSELGDIAYEAGVQQIVDLSSRFVQLDWRTSFIGETHRLAEERLYALALKYNRYLVTLRPSRFFTNHSWTANTIKSMGAVIDCHPADLKVEYISIDDIADVAVKVLTDPVDRHGNYAYTLIGDHVDGRTRAEYFSQALGRPIVYTKMSPKEMFDSSVQHGQPIPLAMDIATVDTTDPPTHVVPILLGRPYETLESWIHNNKEQFM
ncbi:hypothetical protein BC941DRAFT_403153 [Chlamydoabsidia padenii]|nr:hypothetical protein BC941DRAFT_403153 [Chlamydoabsidia padenii]